MSFIQPILDHVFGQRYQIYEKGSTRTDRRPHGIRAYDLLRHQPIAELSLDLFHVHCHKFKEFKGLLISPEILKSASTHNLFP